jgi:PBSX family phage terminase large subunit
MTTGALQHAYKPRGGCREAFIARDPEVLVSGPAGTGKSRAVLEHLHFVMCRYPQAKGLILRKTAASLAASTIETWERFVVAEAKAAGLVTYFGGSVREPPQYRYYNGSKVILGGLDKPTKIMSTEYDIAYINEAIELNVTDWESVTTRLRNGKMPYQQLIADTNPSHPTHWLKLRCDQKATRMIESRHEDNPVLFNDDGSHTERGRSYIEKLDALTGVRNLRLRKGLWVAAEGVIYEDWDPLFHVLPRFVPPKTWQRYWVIDFGYIHPFVCQWWAIDGDGRMFMYREIYMTKRTIDQHAEQIMAQVVNKLGYWQEPKPTAIICDHDAENRARLEECLGMSTISATKTVKPGIEAVQVRLRKQGDGRSRIRILADSLVEIDRDLQDAKKPTCTVDEFAGYVWANNQKEEPVKVNDDGMDCVRYMAAEIDLATQPRVRWIG